MFCITAASVLYASLTSERWKKGTGASLVEYQTPLEVEAYGTGQTVLLWAVRSHVPVLLAAMAELQLYVESCRLGGYSICLCFNWNAFMTPLPEGHPGQLAYTFVILILSTPHT